jgi:multidrug resistance efflux pump
MMSEPTTTLNQETANRTAAGAATQTAAPATPAVTPAAKDSAEGRKLIRNVVALLIVFGAVVLTLYVWSVLERHPRTDDAAARANVVGIVPRVRGPIVNLAVQDNQ